MKDSDTRLLVVLAVVGLGAYLLLNRQAAAGGARPAPGTEAYWQNIIGTLPAELSGEARDKALRGADVTLLQGTVQGASAGAVAGPWGAAIGAGAGAVWSFFK